jgi:hypothetical protein
MDAMTHGSAPEWGHAAKSSGRRFFGPLKIGPFLLGGRRPIHDLRLTDVSRERVYLTFPEGTALAENEVYRIVRPIGRREDPVLVSGQPRKIVAEVQIMKVEESTRALVKVLSGSVIKGTAAERIRRETALWE